MYPPKAILVTSRAIIMKGLEPRKMKFSSKSTKWSRMKKRGTLLNTYFRVFESLLQTIFRAQLRNLGARLDKFAIRYRNDHN